MPPPYVTSPVEFGEDGYPRGTVTSWAQGLRELRAWDAPASGFYRPLYPDDRTTPDSASIPAEPSPATNAQYMRAKAQFEERYSASNLEDAQLHTRQAERHREAQQMHTRTEETRLREAQETRDQWAQAETTHRNRALENERLAERQRELAQQHQNNPVRAQQHRDLERRYRDMAKQDWARAKEYNPRWQQLQEEAALHKSLAFEIWSQSVLQPGGPEDTQQVDEATRMHREKATQLERQAEVAEGHQRTAERTAERKEREARRAHDRAAQNGVLAEEHEAQAKSKKDNARDARRRGRGYQNLAQQFEDSTRGPGARGGSSTSATTGAGLPAAAAAAGTNSANTVVRDFEGISEGITGMRRAVSESELALGRINQARNSIGAGSEGQAAGASEERLTELADVRRRMIDVTVRALDYLDLANTEFRQFDDDLARRFFSG